MTEQIQYIAGYIRNACLKRALLVKYLHGSLTRSGYEVTSTSQRYRRLEGKPASKGSQKQGALRIISYSTLAD